MFNGTKCNAIAKAAIITPSNNISVLLFIQKNSSFRIITIHKGEVVALLMLHNSYARITDTGTKGLEFPQSQPNWLPFVSGFYLIFVTSLS